RCRWRRTGTLDTLLPASSGPLSRHESAPPRRRRAPHPVPRCKRSRFRHSPQASPSGRPGRSRGCLPYLPWLRLDDYGADLGFGDEGPVDMRLAAKTPDAPAITHFLHVIMDGIAGDDRTTEAGFVDCHEVNERRFLELLEMTHAKRTRCLRHAFNKQHARHHR